VATDDVIQQRLGEAPEDEAVKERLEREHGEFARGAARPSSSGAQVLFGHLITDQVFTTLWQFGDGEEHGDVLQGVQGVPPLGNDQQVAVAPFPLDSVSNKAYPTMQHLHSGLAGVLVF
jgi:hypothetical protein